MNVSTRWLKDMVPGLAGTPEELAGHLALRGAPVEAISSPGDGLGDIVVGRVIKAVQHPNADRLSLCEVDSGDGIVQEEGDDSGENILESIAHNGILDVCDVDPVLLAQWPRLCEVHHEECDWPSRQIGDDCWCKYNCEILCCDESFEQGCSYDLLVEELCGNGRLDGFAPGSSGPNMVARLRR